MTLAQSILIGLLYFLANSSLTIVSYVTIYRPLVGGFVTGLILGDPVTGVQVGASIQMMFIGFISAGGALPSDMALAGVLGTALAITGGLSVDAALAIAVPLGLLGTLVWIGRMTFDSVFNRWTNKLVAAGSFKGLWLPTIIIPQLFLYCITGIPCTLACFYGSQVVANVVNALGSSVLGVLGVIGGVMPALGIAITLKFIFKDEKKPFLFLGFLLAAYSGLSMIAIGFFALLVAVIYTQIISHINEAAAGVAAGGDLDLGDDLSLDDGDDTAGEAEAVHPIKKLSKSTLFKCFIMWEWSYQSCYNYENMQAATFLDAMAPAIKELYADDSEETKRAMERHFEFYNIENTTGGAVLGLVLAMEEQRAAGNEVTEDAIRSVKTGLMGPLSGIGDSTVQGVILPLMISFAVSAAAGGAIAPVILYVIAMAAIQLGLAWFMFNIGYRQGSDALLDMLESGTFKMAIEAAGILGCTVLGALIVNFVSVNCGIQIPQGTEMFSLQEGFFDVICPGLLPLLTTLGTYKLIEKGWSSTKTLLLLVVVSGVLAAFGILA